MGSDDAAKLDLPTRYLWLVLPPALLLAAAAFLLNFLGYPIASALHLDGLSGAAEAGARVKVLATWLILAVIGLGSAGYFFWRLRDFRRATVRKLLMTYAGLAAIGVGFAWYGGLEAHRFIGEDFVCESFKALEGMQETPVPAVTGMPAGQDGVTPEGAPGQANVQQATSGETRKEAPAARPPRQLLEETTWRTWTKPCNPSTLHARMTGLNRVQRFLLPLLTPALLLGMIGALAKGPATGFSARVERLNTFLYLSAAVLVAGLLLLSALLRWPGYLLVKDVRAVFDAHAAALVLYWGVVYSLYIALSYLPAAALLKRDQPAPARAAVRVEKGEQKEGKAPDPLLTPIGMLKTAATIFAPAVAALLSGVVDL